MGKVTRCSGATASARRPCSRRSMGLVPSATGSIALDGHDITKAASYSRVRAGIGYVPQGREIFPRLTVEENARWASPLARPAARCRPHLRMFPVLKQMMKRRGATFPAASSNGSPSAVRSPRGPKLLILDSLSPPRHQPSIIKDIRRAIRALAETRRDGDPAGGTVLRLRPLPRRPLPADGRARSSAAAPAPTWTNRVREMLSV